MTNNYLTIKYEIKYVTNINNEKGLLEKLIVYISIQS